MVESNRHLTQKPSVNSSANVALDDVFDALADRQRRKLIRYLLKCDPPISTTEIADALQTRNRAPPVEKHRELRISIHHVHLPKLDEIGILDYDPGAKQVVGWENIETIEPYIDIAETLER
jgi:hypothetical protein